MQQKGITHMKTLLPDLQVYYRTVTLYASNIQKYIITPPVLLYGRFRSNHDRSS